MPRKIIYFDRETIKNMLQERNRGTKIKTTGVEGEANVAVTAKAEASSSIYTPTAVIAPCLTRRESGSLTMPEKPIPKPCPTLNCSAEDFLARLIPNKIRIPKPSRESLQRKDFCIKSSG